MRLRSKRLCLQATGVLCFGLSAACVTLALRFPVPSYVSSPSPSGNATLSDVEENDSPALPSFAEFQELVAMNLQGLLFDPPPVQAEAPPPPPPPPPLGVRLIATMVEKDGATATFSDNQGRIIYRNIGDVLDDRDPPAELVDIAADRVRFRYAQRDVTVKIGESDI